MIGGSIIWMFFNNDCTTTPAINKVIKNASTGIRKEGNLSVTPYLTFFHIDVAFKLAKVIHMRKWAESPSVKIHVLTSMPWNFVWRVSQSMINMSLPDKSLCIDSYAMGVDTPYNKSIASRVKRSYKKPRGATFISSSSSFQTKMDTLIKKLDLSHHFSHWQSHLTLIEHYWY